MNKKILKNDEEGENSYTKRMRENREKLVEFFERKDYKPLKFKEIASLFQVPKKERDSLRLILNDLIREGKIFEEEGGRIEKVGADLVTGEYSSSKRGYGFIRLSEEEENIFVPSRYTENAFDGDKVLVKILKNRMRDGKSREGQIVKILERGTKFVVGTFTKSDTFGFVVPDASKIDKDIYIPKQACKNVPKGYKVVAEIVDYGNFKRSPEGKIVEVLGNENDKGVDILSVARSYGIEDVFSEEVKKEATITPKRIKKADMEGRLDLRSLKAVTIDSKDAKDLDDAVSVEKEVLEDGRVLYHLGVHIADVSHYVKEGSILDKEALKRGTSVYLADMVIPMLPKELSNGICSLNEKVGRLCLSCLMDITEKGEVVSHKIAETVIKTSHRMTYADVNEMITKPEEEIKDLLKTYRDVYPMLQEAYELSLLLRRKRYERGAIDFDFPEAKIIVDKKGRVKDIKAYDRNEATRLIEDFMLIANETVAEDSFWQELPFLYRSHENPSEEKIKALHIFIQNFGYRLRWKRGGKSPKNEEIKPKDIQHLLHSVKGEKEEMMISRMTLRSLKRASYETSSEGHFGLAAKYYTHFTSPIRRYPDLQIHRILKENLRGELSKERRQHYRSILDEVALSSGILERRADEAEREVNKMKAAEFMSSKIGEEFDGVISGVTGNGIYVELPNTVEGLIRLRKIDADYYHFNEEKMEIVGEITGRRFSLGQPVRVKVVNASKELRTVDFELIL